MSTKPAFCAACGKSVPPDARYCRSCGAPQGEAAMPEMDAIVAPEPARSTPRPASVASVAASTTLGKGLNWGALLLGGVWPLFNAPAGVGSLKRFAPVPFGLWFLYAFLRRVVALGQPGPRSASVHLGLSSSSTLEYLLASVLALAFFVAPATPLALAANQAGDLDQDMQRKWKNAGMALVGGYLLLSLVMASGASSVR